MDKSLTLRALGLIFVFICVGSVPENSGIIQNEQRRGKETRLFESTRLQSIGNGGQTG